MINLLPDGFKTTDINARDLPEVDETVILIDSNGRQYEGCLVDGFYEEEGWYWCEWISDSALEERVGKNTPIGWTYK